MLNCNLSKQKDLTLNRQSETPCPAAYKRLKKKFVQGRTGQVPISTLRVQPYRPLHVKYQSIQIYVGSIHGTLAGIQAYCAGKKPGYGTNSALRRGFW